MDFASAFGFAVEINIMWQANADPISSKAVPTDNRLIGTERARRLEVVFAMLIDCRDKIIHKLPTVCFVGHVGRACGTLFAEPKSETNQMLLGER